MNSEAAAFDPTKAGWERAPVKGFLELVGPIWTRRAEDGGVVFGFLAEEKHENRRGVLQGGMMATLLDRAIGVNISQANEGRPQATIQLNIHYLDAVRIGEFVEAHCTIKRRTKTIWFAGATATVGSRPVATADGIWKILGV
jgi:uncharacterized protein (TIGR00369 family)